MLVRAGEGSPATPSQSTLYLRLLINLFCRLTKVNFDHDLASRLPYTADARLESSARSALAMERL